MILRKTFEGVGDSTLDAIFADAEKEWQLEYEPVERARIEKGETAMFEGKAEFRAQVRHPKYPDCVAIMKMQAERYGLRFQIDSSTGNLEPTDILIETSDPGQLTVLATGETPFGAISDLVRYIILGTAQKRLGGPIPTPREDKIRMIKQWTEWQGVHSQKDFCQSKGISDRQFRRWIVDFIEEGKLRRGRNGLLDWID